MTEHVICVREMRNASAFIGKFQEEGATWISDMGVDVES
jgi:hypothetical protein